MKIKCQETVLYALVLAASASFIGCGTEPVESTEYVERVVYALTDSTFEGRETGTPGEGLASAWLDTEFGALGLQAKGTLHRVKRSGTNHIPHASPRGGRGVAYGHGLGDGNRWRECPVQPGNGRDAILGNRWGPL